MRSPLAGGCRCLYGDRYQEYPREPAAAGRARSAGPRREQLISAAFPLAVAAALSAGAASRRFDYGCLSLARPERKAAGTVSYARIAAVTIVIKNGAGKVPGLLAVLALVPDPRRPRGRRFPLVFVLAVAAACTLAGAKTFREIGDQAADLSQKVLRDLGGKPHPLRRKVIAPSETRIRTLLHLTDTEILEEITGRWLRDLAAAGRLDGLLTAIAIDGKWLRGVLDGQVKLFAAMLHTEKTVIAQHRIPDDTTETTQVRELLEHVDLDGAVVTADAASAQRDSGLHRGQRRRRRPGICVLPV